MARVRYIQYAANMDLVYFSGPTIQENLALKVTSGSTKVHLSICTRYVQYAAIMDLVYFSGPTIQENLTLKVTS